MSYYDNQAWQAPARQSSWEQPPPPSRSGASSTIQHEDPSVFGTQLEEVDRAIDNLVKSGKLFGMPTRRDSMPLVGAPRPYSDYGKQSKPIQRDDTFNGMIPDQRMGGGMPQRHHSITDYDPLRSHSASNLQNFYATQRYQTRPSEAEQMMQAKRRMAAQRERELRNYHQEQQYNRSLLAEISTQGKPDRATSPSTMNDEDRRELIARQHRALYGNENTPYYENGGFGDDGHTPRPIAAGSNAPPSAVTGARGPSPLAFDPFGMGQNQGQAGANENAGQYTAKEQSHIQQAAGPGPSSNTQQQRSRANSNASPSSNNNSFSLFDTAAQQSSRTSTSSPGGSPPRQATKSSTAPIGSGVAPIGTRPSQTVQAQAPNPALNKRSTTPLPSPLSYGFASNETSNANERSTSAASNPSAAANKDANVGLGWGSNSGVWGNKNSLGVQASVWG